MTVAKINLNKMLRTKLIKRYNQALLIKCKIFYKIMSLCLKMNIHVQNQSSISKCNHWLTGSN